MRRVATYLLGVLVVLVSVMGCGKDDPSSNGAGDVAAALKDPQRCLSELGASRAVDRDDINFFIEDFEKGETDKPAGAGNGIIAVGEYTHPLVGEPSGALPSPDYLVWVGGPADEPDLEPDRRQRAEARKCLDNLGVAVLGPVPDYWLEAVVSDKFRSRSSM